MRNTAANRPFNVDVEICLSQVVFATLTREKPRSPVRELTGLRIYCVSNGLVELGRHVELAVRTDAGRNHADGGGQLGVVAAGRAEEPHRAGAKGDG